MPDSNDNLSASTSNAGNDLIASANNSESSAKISKNSVTATVKMQNSVLFNEFNPDLEDIEAYFDRFDCFVACNAITEEKIVNFLIASIGAKVYAKLRLLAVPKRPTELTYTEIQRLLKAEYIKVPLVHVAQHSFRQRTQKEGESFKDFYNALKELARDCQFSTDDRLKEELKTQIISGIRDRKTQGYFFMTKNLSLEDVVHKAEIDEQAITGLDHFRPNGTERTSGGDEIHKLHDRYEKKQFVKKGKQSRFNRKPPAKRTYSSVPEDAASMSKDVVCYRCARPNHKATTCRFRNATCNKCGKPGHIAPACGRSRDSFHASSSSGSDTKVNQLEPYEIAPLYAVEDRDPKDKIMVRLQVDGKPALFEADSGSRYAVMSKARLNQLGLTRELQPCYILLQSYSKALINVIGCIYVDVVYKGKLFKELRLCIVEQDYDTVFGREWWYILNFTINFDAPINQVTNVNFDLRSALTNLAVDFKDIFSECIGTLKNMMFNVTLKDDAKPVFCRHRNVVFALREPVDREIDRLIEEKIYEPVESADWATPIVIVQKSNGSVRIVGDYSVTLNRFIVPEDYPIPNIEEILYDFGCCSYYSKFDVREAYMHMPVTPETAKLLTVNTPRGLFKVNRMNYGIQSAPAKWQRYVETIFKPVAGCRCFYDDVKISSENPREHLARVKLFFEICRENNVHLRKEKCQLLSKELEYLGFRVNEKGIHKTTGKVEAVLNAKAPANVTEVKAFAGLVGFYGRFVPNLSAMFYPINQLLRKDVPFEWSQKCQEAFDAIKREIASPRVLCHFDPRKKLILATDASPYAIGAVLSHECSDGEHPIAFASRTLSKSEQNYSQIDKESLAIFWGVKRFFNYLFGRCFTLYVDCKPLQSIFAKNTAKPTLSATRLLHYAIFLQGFDYEIRYRRSEDHGNADFLSRFPVEVANQHMIDEPALIGLHQICTLPINVEKLAEETERDPETSKILKKLRQPEQNEIENTKFSIEQGCLLFNNRVFIPENLRRTILEELHLGHLGAGKMKGLARNYVYWPKIDGMIEKMVQKCVPCQANANSVAAPIHPWMRPSAPWERVHVDYAGPFLQSCFLIVVDAYSKWPEVFIVPSSQTGGTSSSATIDRLAECFARFGCPVTLVSDNGPQFTSREFVEFCRNNCIKQLHSAPYFPQSNGQAERFVQTIKRALKIAMLENPSEPVHRKLQRFLMAYRRAPVLPSGESPSQLMLNRRIRTRIDVLRGGEAPKSSGVSEKIEEGATVWFKVFHCARNWERGIVLRRIGNVMFDIRDTNGQVQRRHLSQIRKDHTLGGQFPSSSASTDAWPLAAPPLSDPVPETAEEAPQDCPENSVEQQVDVPHEPAQPAENPDTAPEVRRSDRPKRAPLRFSP